MNMYIKQQITASMSLILRINATKYFFNTSRTVCFMHGLSTYVIKRIYHHAPFFISSHGSFQHLTNFQKKWKNNTSPKYQAKIVVESNNNVL